MKTGICVAPTATGTIPTTGTGTTGFVLCACRLMLLFGKRTVGHAVSVTTVCPDRKCVSFTDDRRGRNGEIARHSPGRPADFRSLIEVGRIQKSRAATA